MGTLTNIDSGRITMPAGGAAVRFGSAISGSVVVRNPSGNSTVYVGNADVDSTDGFPLKAGEDIVLDLQSINAAYFAGTEGNVINWLTVGG
jgi:hypothetical protein